MNKLELVIKRIVEDVEQNKFANYTINNLYRFCLKFKDSNKAINLLCRSMVTDDDCNRDARELPGEVDLGTVHRAIQNLNDLYVKSGESGKELLFPVKFLETWKKNDYPDRRKNLLNRNDASQPLDGLDCQ